MTVRRIGSFIKGVLIGILAIFGGVFALTGVSDTWRAYTVLSDSMAPTITRGSVVFVQKRAQYDVGDVVTRAVPGSMPVTHRVTAVRTAPNGMQYVQTKGDANAVPDEGFVAAANIFGAVVAHVPLLGYVIAYLQTPQGFLLLIVVPATLIIYHEILAIATHVERRLRRMKRRGEL